MTQNNPSEQTTIDLFSKEVSYFDFEAFEKHAAYNTGYQSGLRLSILIVGRINEKAEAYISYLPIYSASPEIDKITSELPEVDLEIKGEKGDPQIDISARNRCKFAIKGDAHQVELNLTEPDGTIHLIRGTIKGAGADYSIEWTED